MGIDGYVLVCMGMYGYISVFMGMYGYIWVCMGMYVCHISLNKTANYGQISKFNVVYGSVSIKHFNICMGMYGYVQVCMGMYGYVLYKILL